MLPCSLLALLACGGSSGPPPAPWPPPHPSALTLLGVSCDPFTRAPCNQDPTEGVVCGNDRFGWTCTAYCGYPACAGAVCLDRLGLADAGLTGFCWRPCATTADCVSDLKCHPEGVCAP